MNSNSSLFIIHRSSFIISGTESPDQLQPVAGDLEAFAAERLDQFRRELLDEVRVVGQRQVAHLAGAFAAEVIMGVAAGIVTGGAGFVGDASGQAGADQRSSAL